MSLSNRYAVCRRTARHDGGGSRVITPFLKNYVARARRKAPEVQASFGSQSVSLRLLHLEVLHRDDYISLLVPSLNMLESFRDLLQGITSVDDSLSFPTAASSAMKVILSRLLMATPPLIFFPR